MHFLIGKVSVNICSTHRAFVDVLEALLTHTVVPTVQQRDGGWFRQANCAYMLFVVCVGRSLKSIDIQHFLDAKAGANDPFQDRRDHIPL